MTPNGEDQQVSECPSGGDIGRARAIAADFERRLSAEDRLNLTTASLCDERGFPA